MRHFINAQFINSRADNTMVQNRALFLLYGCMEKEKNEGEKSQAAYRQDNMTARIIQSCRLGLPTTICNHGNIHFI